jgi:hypothetical protein
VPALHREGVQVRAVVTADVAHESLDLLYLGRVCRCILAKARTLQNLFRLLHVLVDQAFLVPSQVSEQYRSGFGRLAEDVGHLGDLVVLLCLDLHRVKHFEIDFVGLFAGLDVLIL